MAGLELLDAHDLGAPPGQVRGRRAAHAAEPEDDHLRHGRSGSRESARHARQPVTAQETVTLAPGLDRLHLLGDAHGLLDEGLHDLRLGDGLDDLALDEDLALAVAGGDAEVGLAGLTRAVDDAAHHGDAQRHLEAVETGGDLLGQLVDVDLGAAAGGAGDDLEAARLEVERLQDLEADLDLLDRRRGERDPDGVADALAQQGAEGDRRLDGALERRPGLGDAEVQRPVAGLGEQLVGAHHHDRVVVLDRDLEVVEVVLLEQAGLPHGTLDERLGRGLAVLVEDPLVEAAGVDADPDRGAAVLGGRGDLLDLVVELADVAGVDADGGAAGVDRGEDVLRLEVDVGDDRDLRVLGDLGQRVGVVLGRAGDAHDVAAGRRQLGDLLQGGVDVGGERGRHRLHRDRVVAADPDLADLDLAGLAAGSQHRRRRFGHPQADRGHRFRLPSEARADSRLAGREAQARHEPADLGHGLVQRCATRPAVTTAGGSGRRGRRRSAPRPSRAAPPRRRRRSAAAWRRRRSRGRGGRDSRARPRRTASQSAPAMWPPSSGSSGMKLNSPMKKLKPATSISRKTTFSPSGEVVVGRGLAGDPAAADDAHRAVERSAPRRRRWPWPRPTP